MENFAGLVVNALFVISICFGHAANYIKDNLVYFFMKFCGLFSDEKVSKHCQLCVSDHTGDR